MKARRRFGFKEIEMGIQDIFAPAAVEIDVLGHAGFIQPVEQLWQRLLIPPAPEGLSQVIVRVDHREAWSVYRGGLRYEFGTGAKIS
jgi:hypothetical protein